jgi:hypothetical protein
MLQMELEFCLPRVSIQQDGGNGHEKEAEAIHSG